MPRQTAAGERGHDRHHRQAKADEVAAGVAHEESRRRAIVIQEAHQRTDKHQQETGHEQLRLLRVGIGRKQHHGRQHRGRDGGHPGRQPVHVVEHVERVDRATRSTARLSAPVSQGASTKIVRCQPRHTTSRRHGHFHRQSQLPA